MTGPSTEDPRPGSHPWGELTPPLDSAASILDGMAVGVLVCTPDGDRPNSELRRIWRFGPRRALDRRAIERSFRPLDGRRSAGAPGPLVQPITSALAGQPAPMQQVAIERADGSSGVVRVAAMPVRFGAEAGAVLTAIDETARHETERLRDAFLGVLGHELRSPVSSILGAAELIRDLDLPKDVQLDLAGDLSEEARRLHELVEQLIRLADLQRLDGTLADEPTHLVHLARSRIQRWRQRRPRLVIELQAPPGPAAPVAGEAGYVTQVIDAMIDNAAKYAGTATPVVVRIEDGPSEIRLHVLDEGPGLPRGARDPIFGLFQRAAARPAGAGISPVGLGIGLFVARSIVEALGGRVWAVNRPEGGADVGFALPIATG